jgi:hypothetical protein
MVRAIFFSSLYYLSRIGSTMRTGDGQSIEKFGSIVLFVQLVLSRFDVGDFSPHHDLYR